MSTFRIVFQWITKVFIFTLGKDMIHISHTTQWRTRLTWYLRELFLVCKCWVQKNVLHIHTSYVWNNFSITSTFNVWQLKKFLPGLYISIYYLTDTVRGLRTYRTYQSTKQRPLLPRAHSKIPGDIGFRIKNEGEKDKRCVNCGFQRGDRISTPW